MASVASAAAVSFPALFGANKLYAATPAGGPIDTLDQIFTAALVAEDLAVTFYYNVLVGSVITNTSLAGPGGSATKFSSKGDPANVFYLRAALAQEMDHAALFRGLLGISDASGDPYQTFYFDPTTFSDIGTFLTLLNALEEAFIGAYMCAIKEFGEFAVAGQNVTVNSTVYKPTDFALLAKIASTILGIEAEHRVLGRDIAGNENPTNNLNYEQGFGVYTVYNGPMSAVGKLTPFLSAGSGTQAYSLQTALTNAPSVVLKTSGTYPRS